MWNLEFSARKDWDGVYVGSIIIIQDENLFVTTDGRNGEGANLIAVDLVDDSGKRCIYVFETLCGMGGRWQHN